MDTGCLSRWTGIYLSIITGGNVVRVDRTVMQMKSLRDHPDMSYGSNKQWNQLCEKSCFSCFYRLGALYKETENAIPSNVHFSTRGKRI